MIEPRTYTADEMRDKFLEHVRNVASYWTRLPDIDRATGKPMTIKDRCEGVAFSILVAIDGSSMNLPSFDLVARPHEDDKEFHISNGENWIEPGTVINECMLHDFFYKKENK